MVDTLFERRSNVWINRHSKAARLLSCKRLTHYHCLPIGMRRGTRKSMNSWRSHWLSTWLFAIIHSLSTGSTTWSMVQRSWLIVQQPAGVISSDNHENKFLFATISWGYFSTLCAVQRSSGRSRESKSEVESLQELSSTAGMSIYGVYISLFIGTHSK